MNKIIKNLGYSIGWVIGMLLQLIIAPRFSDDFINKGWWIGQIIGLIVFIIIVNLIKKNLIKINWSWFKNIEWSNIGENLIELSKHILNNIYKYLCKLWDFINEKSIKIINIIINWLKS